MVREAVEQVVEERMRAHREPDGAYACDVHVMVGYVLDALAAGPTPQNRRGDTTR